MDTFSLFISNLPKDTTEEELSKMFSSCGDVKGVYISCAKPELVFCYGFVRFKEAECVTKAMEELGHWVLRSKTLRVEISHATKEKLRLTTAPRYPSWKRATRDSNDRSRVKEACCVLNKELDLVHGDEALDLVDLLASIEEESVSCAPRVKGTIYPEALSTKESVLNGLEAFSSETAVTEQRKADLEQKMASLEADIEKHHRAFSSETAVTDQRKADLEQKMASLEADIEKHHTESVRRKADLECRMTKLQSSVVAHPDSASVNEESDDGLAWLNYGKLHASCDNLSLNSGINIGIQAEKLDNYVKSEVSGKTAQGGNGYSGVLSALKSQQTLQSQGKRQTAASSNATLAALGRGRGQAVLDHLKRS